MDIDCVLHQDSLPYLAAMPDKSVDVVITDPPYPNGLGLFSEFLIDGIAGLYLAAKKAKRSVIFFWSPLVDPPQPPPGFFRTATHIWHKPDGKTSIRYETIHVWSRDYKRQPYRVFDIPILEFSTRKDWQETHPTQKPVRLMRYLIEQHTQEGDVILDPFAGTGTTGVAARQLKRHYVLIETNKEYADFASARLAPREATAPTAIDEAQESATPAIPSTTTPKARR